MNELDEMLEDDVIKNNLDILTRPKYRHVSGLIINSSGAGGLALYINSGLAKSLGLKKGDRAEGLLRKV